tara:strand:- start:6740 stop:8221 length:1482 start_codon:yes stop_codon:yes gene_type:complete
MAATFITQKPLYNQMPVGQEMIWVVENSDAVQNQKQVKYGVNIHISKDSMPSVNVTTHLVGTFKTTPNNEGVGMFDLRNVAENYVSADNMTHFLNFPGLGAQYKGTYSNNRQQFPLHVIDKYSRSPLSNAFLVLEFFVEYLGATDVNGLSDPNVVRIADGTQVTSEEYKLFNGYLKYDDKQQVFNNDFGFDLTNFYPTASFPVQPNKKFLTNAPVEQYANVEDYGTVQFLLTDGGAVDGINVGKIKLNYYDCDGNSIGNEEVLQNTVNGGVTVVIPVKAQKQSVFFGCFPGNLQNWSTTFQALVSNSTILGGKITFQAYKEDAIFGELPTTKIYTIHVNCPEQKNFEPIRLCWLNQWGAWDYYTFTKKSTRTTSAKSTTYHQLSGTWNESKYFKHSHRGGKKNFRMNATERIRMNTGFVSEDNNVMFEELINSPEVYMLEGYQTDIALPLLNQYVKPVRLTTSSFTRKTQANDNLIQYTFEIEKSKTLRTQSI